MARCWFWAVVVLRAWAEGERGWVNEMKVLLRQKGERMRGYVVETIADNIIMCTENTDTHT